MKVTVNRDEFQAAFNLCAKVASSRPQRPILGNVLMEVGESDILLTANDGQTCIRVNTSHVDFEGFGRTLLSKDRAGAILSSHQDDHLTISSDSKDCVRFVTPTATYTLITEDPDGFPACPEGTVDAVKHTVDAESLVSMVKLTSFAAGKDSTRWATGGILVESGSEGEGPAKLTFVSTDGKRLAHTSVACDVDAGNQGCSFGKRGTISSWFAALMLDCLRGVEGPVVLTTGRHCSVMSVGRITLSSQLVGGDFPAYQRILEGSRSGTIALNCGEFRRALQQANAMTDDLNSRSVLFQFSRCELLLSSGADGSGNAWVSFPIDAKIDPIDIRLDPEYLLQALNILGDSADIFLDVSGSTSPVVIRMEGRGYTYVVMPMSPGNIPKKSRKK